MILALLRKEVSEHALALAALALVLFSTFALLTLPLAHDVADLPMVLYAAFCAVPMPLAAWVVSSRLVTRALRHRTHLFLAGLPVRWSVVLWLKYVLGLAFLVPIQVLACLACLAMSLQRVPVSAETADLAFFGGLVWISWCWTAAFVLALMGRLRMPLLVTLLAAYALVPDVVSGAASVVLLPGSFLLSIWDFYGGSLFVFLTGVLLPTLVYTGLLAAGGMTLGSFRRGELAAALSQPLPTRVKVGCALILVAVAGVATLREQAETPTHRISYYALVDPEVRAEGGVSVQVAHAGPYAAALAEDLLRELVEVGAALHINEVASVRVRYSCGPGELDSGTVWSGAPGEIVAAACHDSADFHPRQLLPQLFGEIVDHEGARARREPVRWVRDGFGMWWLGRTDEPTRRQLERRAAVALAEPPSVADLAAWETTRRRHGDEMAVAVAWSALSALASAYGEDAVLDLIRDAIVPRRPEDLIAPWRDRHRHSAGLFARHLGVVPAQVESVWRAQVAGLRAGHPEVSHLAPPVATVRVDAASDDWRRVHLSVGGVPSEGAWVRYALASPVGMMGRPNVDHFSPARARDGVYLRRALPAGQELLLTVSAWSEPLGCHLQTPLQRVHLP